MADDPMTPGEVKRTFDRQDSAIRATNDRLADLAKSMVPTELWAAEHRALEDKLAHLERDTLNGLSRIENAAGERHKAIGREIRDLKELVEREIEDVREDLKALQEHRRQEHEQSSSRLIAWVAALAAVGLLIATILQSGGH